MKKFLILLIALWYIPNISAQTDNLQINLQLNMLKQSLLSKDYEVYTFMMYEGVLQEFGSRQEAVSFIKANFEILENQGFIVKDLIFTDISDIIEQDNTQQFTLLQHIIVDSPEGSAELSSTLIGISKDKGFSWKFLGTNSKVKEEMLGNYPELSKNLIFHKAEVKLLNTSEK